MRFGEKAQVIAQSGNVLQVIEGKKKGATPCRPFATGRFIVAACCPHRWELGGETLYLIVICFLCISWGFGISMVSMPFSYLAAIASLSASKPR